MVSVKKTEILISRFLWQLNIHKLEAYESDIYKLNVQVFYQFGMGVDKAFARCNFVTH